MNVVRAGRVLFAATLVVLFTPSGAGAQDAACDEFRVGSPKWQDCIEDAATGGGLMPWIVIIPIGLMVLGMMIAFFFQFRGKGQRATGSVAGTAGNWLLFVGFIELLIGGGMMYASLTTDDVSGGFRLAGIILLGTAAILVVIGIIAKGRGARRRRIEETGIQGEARVVGIGQTGMMINDQPVLALELDVQVPGAAPFRTVHRETVPRWYQARLGDGNPLPVKADPEDPTKIIIDWSRLAL